ncbi:hypothetical protein K461DRAFT_279499 [Myriangium duriaei CBS 260.36]|uniref:CCCH zinc finger and SMR domain-containing protein n=1 Tax=Myriangium duriaei CBS 260.36 TaxID=1168546 RepID=A0A9P4IY09_9PEZI|nr:hypothetical protein K461DRAFT_279499 [Myriangium duriaei CBS 260.36]
MVSDTVYELCEPILKDDALTEEDKTDKVEDLLKKELGLTGKALEDAVLGVLWRQRGSDITAIRPTVVRRPSPAPWQINRSGTPVSASPRSISGTINAPPGLGAAPPLFKRTKSSTASPSPRPSPRLTYATPIPHSPSLSAYQFSEPSPVIDNYGDMGSDNVDWLVNDDASSTTSWGDSGFASNSSEFMQPINVEMTPYDLIRSVLRDERSDDDLNKLLEANGYDLGQTIASLMETQGGAEQQQAQQQPAIGTAKTYLIGKSLSPSSRPMTPSGQSKSPIVCRYFLASGHCARADCRFSHDLTNHLCKYWMNGNCLAGDACMFSHDPSLLMSRLNMEAGKEQQPDAVDFQVQDLDLFPALKRSSSNPFEAVDSPTIGSPVSTSAILAQSAMNPNANFVPGNFKIGTDSRPNSQQTSRAATPSGLVFQDDEAFPSLGFAAAAKSGKRHHGKRGHGHATTRENQTSSPSSMADIVRMSPTPASPVPMLQTRRGLRPVKSFTGSRESGATTQAIPAPEHIPWLETGEEANRAYLKARAEAFRHGGLRNKFLQGAAQAWNRNDARGAKALSLRGQNENALMKEAHREAARVLYDERNKCASSGKELYVDLHGLHPEEAVSYLNTCLLEHKHSARPLYAICGTGHHSKNGKDKIGKAVRAFLNEWRYAFREFSVPGDRNNLGGIIGIDPSSYDMELVRRIKTGEGSEADSGIGMTPSGEDTKIRLITAEEARLQKQSDS